jgi:DNA ligase-1
LPQIKKPLLAGKYDPQKAKFPYIVTPKIDGIRFIMVKGQALSRSFKPIRNEYIQALLAKHLPDGIDGEITSGKTIQSSTSAINSINGKPDFKIWIFDYVDLKDEILPYYLRVLNFPSISDEINHTFLHGVNVKNQQELDEIEKLYLENGFEGAMVRDPMGTYKFGRSSVKENILLKLKRFEDDEAVLIDIEEKMHNENEAELNAFGNIKRSSSIEGLVGSNTTGTLIALHSNGHLIRIGSGLTDELRNEIWTNKNKYIGKLVKYKYFPYGVKELPRHAVFLSFRDTNDL